MNITAKEHAVLNALLRNLFTGVNGAVPKNYTEASDWIWSNCINDSAAPSGIEGKELAGVCGSLAVKGLIQADGNSGRDACIRLTEEGYKAITK